MRFNWTDVVATIPVATIVVSYVGHLVDGDVPFIQDPRGMVGAGLALGLIAAAVLGRSAFGGSPAGRGTGAAGLVSFTFGVVVLLWSGNGVIGEVLLGSFIGSIVVTWALAVVLPAAGVPRTRRRRSPAHS
ncbi:hypothetical protein ACVGVM_12340 [Pseudonocardia bannensis]|uniref:Uncharacterized protein n=1 Tax=Pseudonocardia bannensis TaxID=630973 RepID=A0A848DET5_9PSEU|nr:hypothetical protein [Pseudonocardia bannensis]NMH91096.1 hypothetical protein [Pseudonocardia bannensis]